VEEKGNHDILVAAPPGENWPLGNALCGVSPPLVVEIGLVSPNPSPCAPDPPAPKLLPLGGLLCPPLPNCLFVIVGDVIVDPAEIDVRCGKLPVALPCGGAPPFCCCLAC
jgi:hypothetical protein